MDEPVRPDAAAAQDAAIPPPSTDRPEAPSAAVRTAAGPAPPSRIPGLTPRVLVLLVGAVALGVILYFGRHALGPFVVGLVLAYVLDGPVERMARIGVPRWASVLLVYVLAVVVIVLAVRAVIRPLTDEISTFIREFPAFVAQVTDLYAHLDLPPALREAIDNWLESLGQGVGGFNPGDLLPVFTGLAGVVGSIVGYVVVPVWVFYLIKDRPALTRAAESSLPAPWRADARAAAGVAPPVVGPWLRGQGVLGVGVGGAAVIGLAVLRLSV